MCPPRPWLLAPSCQATLVKEGGSEEGEFEEGRLGVARGMGAPWKGKRTNMEGDAWWRERKHIWCFGKDRGREEGHGTLWLLPPRWEH